MSDYKEIVMKLRGFVEISGEEPPTPEQWDNLVDVLYGEDEEEEEEEEPDGGDTISDIWKKLNDNKPRVSPLPYPPYQPPGSGPWGPYGPPGYPSLPITFSDNVACSSENPKIGDTGDVTVVYNGITLTNSLDMDEVEELVDIEPNDIGPKILETEAVEFNYSEEVPEDDRDTGSGGSV